MGGHQCLWCDTQQWQWCIEGGGGGRAAYDGAVACDGAEGKQQGGWHVRSGGKGGGGHMRWGQRLVEPAPSMWVGTRGSGLGAQG